MAAGLEPAGNGNSIKGRFAGQPGVWKMEHAGGIEIELRQRDARQGCRLGITCVTEELKHVA